MSSKHPIIIITGDICIDWLQFPLKAKDTGLNWELQPGLNMITKPGGALFLSEIIQKSTKALVLSPELKDIEKTQPEKFLHSNVELDIFPYSCDQKEKNKPVYRIKRFLGYTGPAIGTPELLHVKNDNPDAEIVVLDDSGNGFREKKEYWPKAILTKDKNPVVIYKMSRPLASGKLWDHVCKIHSKKLVVIITF